MPHFVLKKEKTKRNPKQEGKETRVKRIERDKQWCALAGNRTRVNCLEGSYANHYTTNALLIGEERIFVPIHFYVKTCGLAAFLKEMVLRV